MTMTTIRNADDTATLEFLTKLGDYTGEPRDLYNRTDCPLPAARLKASLDRLRASGQVELAEVQKTSKRTDDSITAEWRAGIELAAARGDAHSRKVAASWNEK